MDHTYIEEHQVVERYAMGKLQEPELALFEEHYLSCPRCLDRLALAEAMERGFKRAASEDTHRLVAARHLAVVAWLARLGRSRQMALVATALLVAVLPASLAVREARQRGRELTETRSALVEERARSAAGSREAVAEAEKLRAELEESRLDLAQEQEARARTAAELAAARSPQANVPILFLNAERGGGPPSTEPTYRLRLPESPGWIVLALEIEPPHQASYRAALRDSRGKEIWRGADLRPNELETLSLSLPTSLLAPGDYALSVEGVPPGGKPMAAGRFSFRVLPGG